jgi:NADPH-dependent ferric siderophore reductase
MPMTTDNMTRHRIEKMRNTTRRRKLTVVSSRYLTPKMLRIELQSPDLHDFASHGADDHIKLFVPDSAAPEGMSARDYTPRAFDAAKGLLTIDFAVHDDGPATLWALGAKPGDTLEIGGPRGSTVVPDDFDWYLMVGDETALPAISRRLGELREGVPAIVIVVADAPDEVQVFSSRAAVSPVWTFRDGAPVDDVTLLRDALRAWQTPPGDGYVWIAAEARVARLLREYMLDERNHPKAWMRAAGYWVRGSAGAAERFEG